MDPILLSQAGSDVVHLQVIRLEIGKKTYFLMEVWQNVNSFQKA